MRDVNGDGYNDILVFKDSNQLGTADKTYWFQNLTNGTFSNAKYLFKTRSFKSFGRTYQQFKFGDLDGDSDIDVFSISQNEDSIIWHENVSTLVSLNTFSTSFESNFNVFPNPFQDKWLTIDFGNIQFNGQLRIIDFQGRIIKEHVIFQQYSYQFEINAPYGTYIIELLTSDSIEQFKVILN